MKDRSEQCDVTTSHCALCKLCAMWQPVCETVGELGGGNGSWLAGHHLCQLIRWRAQKKPLPRSHLPFLPNLHIKSVNVVWTWSNSTFPILNQPFRSLVDFFGKDTCRQMGQDKRSSQFECGLPERDCKLHLLEQELLL